MRITSLPDERWVMKAAGWNYELSTKYKTYRVVRRPKSRWENETNEFLKPEETETTTRNVMKNNNTWIKVAKNSERWKQQKDLWTMSQRNPPQDPIRPALYLNGVKLDDDEVANIM